VALRLRARGIARVRPLLGGYEAWQSKGFPLEASPGRPAVAAVTTA
jgi:3-mercaptopyruvate sulfurtransferase SseA